MGIENELKDLRKKYGLTQKELSEKLGIPQRTIENWEGGQRKPPQWVINLIEFKLEHDD